MAWAGAGTRSTRDWLRTRLGSQAGLAEDSARDLRRLGMVGSWNHGLGWQWIRALGLVAKVKGLSWRTWREQLGLAAGLHTGLVEVWVGMARIGIEPR